MDSDDERLPKLIVFDLDYTLWPFWVDSHVDPPFYLDHAGFVRDSGNTKIKLYPDVVGILQELKEKGIALGVASRTGAVYEAKDLMNLLNISSYFKFREIYPGSKLQHFAKLQADSGLPYADMLFFDDEQRNIRDVSSLGVTCILARDGLNRKCFEVGLHKFKSNLSSPQQRTMNDYFKEGGKKKP